MFIRNNILIVLKGQYRLAFGIVFTLHKHNAAICGKKICGWLRRHICDKKYVPNILYNTKTGNTHNLLHNMLYNTKTVNIHNLLHNMLHNTKTGNTHNLLHNTLYNTKTGNTHNLLHNTLHKNINIPINVVKLINAV